jgi:hypothetical protein
MSANFFSFSMHCLSRRFVPVAASFSSFPSINYQLSSFLSKRSFSSFPSINYHLARQQRSLSPFRPLCRLFLLPQKLSFRSTSTTTAAAAAAKKKTSFFTLKFLLFSSLSASVGAVAAGYHAPDSVGVAILETFPSLETRSAWLWLVRSYGQLFQQLSRAGIYALSIIGYTVYNVVYSIYRSRAVLISFHSDCL